MDLVEKNHLKPPARADMILGSAQGLLQEATTPVPADLRQRAAAVTSEVQLAALLFDLWPRSVSGATKTNDKIESACLDGLCESVPGKLALHTKSSLVADEQIRNNRYIGIGVQLKMDEEEKVPRFTLLFRRGSALRSGVRTGDLLLEINGQSTKDVSINKIIEWIRGEEGTTITIAVRQPGGEVRNLRVPRAVVPFDSLCGLRHAEKGDWDYIADRQAGIGYVWFKSIKASTVHELRQLERRLQAEGLRALVVDLRCSQCDGDLHLLALTADGLLDKGLLWTIRDNSDTPREVHSQPDCLFRNWPMVVLMNENIDSGHGALLAALQDRHRALLVGEETKTAGLIRTNVPLPENDGAVAVISVQLERAAKERGWPVRPDHVVAMTKEQRMALQKWFNEKDLLEPPAGHDEYPNTDPQLARGLELLRATLQAQGPVAGGK
jgi:carboxyl-terminal processing protease